MQYKNCIGKIPYANRRKQTLADWTGSNLKMLFFVELCLFSGTSILESFACFCGDSVKWKRSITSVSIFYVDPAVYSLSNWLSNLSCKQVERNISHYERKLRGIAFGEVYILKKV